MRNRGFRAALLPVILVVGAVAAAACRAPSPPPPPPVTPTTCNGQSQATPTPSQPVNYAAVVQKRGWAKPDVESFTATSEADKNAKVAQLQTTGTVLAVGPNKTVTVQSGTDAPIATNNYPDYPSQWGLLASPGGDFKAAWDQGYTGTGQTIAIVDTGVDLTHTGLVGRVTAGPDYVAGGNVTGDPYGHGTHVAGIAAANQVTTGGLGGAPTAHLVAVRVLDASGTGSDQNVANGIIWAATPVSSGGGGATVINLSLGAAGCDSVLQQAAATAESDGAVVVAAAGNSDSSGLFSPAGYSNDVLAAAATDQNGNKAGFSNFGAYVAIGAPGVNVVSTCAWTGGGPEPCINDPSGETSSDTAYGVLSGTSMATPFVSAAVALIKEECPFRSYSLAQIKALLQHNSGGAVPSEAFNRLDVGAAVAANCPVSP
jgi:subtilisin family serine protease